MVLYVYSLKASSSQNDKIEYIKKELSLIYKDIVSISYNDFLTYDLSNVNKLIFSGGDGTFYTVINRIINYPDIILGYIPLGTANDMGHNLGIKDYNIALDIIKKGNVIEYSPLEAVSNDKTYYFNYAISFGNMSKVSNEAKKDNKKKLHRFAYLIRGCKYLFCKRELVTTNFNGKEVAKKVRALIIYRTSRLGGYKIITKKDDKLRISFIKNIFNLGMMFILHHPIHEEIDNVEVKTNAIASIDGEKIELNDVIIRKSKRRIKIYSDINNKK